MRQNSGERSAPTIDASSDESFKTSVQEVSNALDEATREEFENAMQVLLFSGSKATNLIEWSADLQAGGMERRFKAAVDGKTAAVHWTTTVHDTESDERFTSELAAFIEIEDGKVISFLEFLDAGLARRMLDEMPEAEKTKEGKA